MESAFLGSWQGGAAAMRCETAQSGSCAHNALLDSPASPPVERQSTTSQAHEPSHVEVAHPTPASTRQDAQARAHNALAHSLVTLWLQPVQALQGGDDFVPVPLRA